MIRSLRFVVVVATTLVSGCLLREQPAPVVQHDTGRQVAALSAATSTSAPVAEGGILVRPGDTLYGIARRENVPARALIEANGLVPPYHLKAGRILRLPEQPGVYVVQKGDSFGSIAQRLGLEAWVLAEANHVKPPYAVQPGQRLTVPKASTGIVVAATAGVASKPTPANSKALAVRAEPVRPPATEIVSTATVPSAPRSSVEAVPLATPLATPLDAPARAEQAPPSTMLPSQPVPSPVAVVRTEPEEAPKPKPVVHARMLTPEPAARAMPAVARATMEPPARAGRHFAWPVKGKLISSFGPQSGGLHNDGLNIAAEPGAKVVAAENGVVAYAGGDLKGFGNLLLVKHAGGFVTAYAHNDKLLVKKGDTVRRGQPIATVGDSGAVNRPQVHFQVRQGAHAVDPRPLMERSS